MQRSLKKIFKISFRKYLKSLWNDLWKIFEKISKIFEKKPLKYLGKNLWKNLWKTLQKTLKKSLNFIPLKFFFWPFLSPFSQVNFKPFTLHLSGWEDSTTKLAVDVPFFSSILTLKTLRLINCFTELDTAKPYR